MSPGFLELAAKKKSATCKGFVYRFKTSTYLEKRGVLATVSRWIPQKRMSCGGCGDCSGFNLEEDARNGAPEDIEIEVAHGPVDGAYYRAEWRADPITGPEWINEGDGHWEMVLIEGVK